jgi:nucleoside-diphosphate-sugar epimerase
MATFLVTGGAGFIGSHIVEELVRRGETVRVLDNFATAKRENLWPFRDAVEIVEGDIRSYHIVREAVQGVDSCCIRRPCRRCPGRCGIPSPPTRSTSAAR